MRGEDLAWVYKRLGYSSYCQLVCGGTLTFKFKLRFTKLFHDLAAVFDLKDMGILKYFLGLQIHYQDNGDIIVNQSKYVKDLFHKAGMDSCKPVNTPCKPHSQLLVNEGKPLSNATLYRSLVGSLQYLTFTQPDIAFVVNNVSQFMSPHTDVHFACVKRILRYLPRYCELWSHLFL